jgi:hypothetical protein
LIALIVIVLFSSACSPAVTSAAPSATAPTAATGTAIVPATGSSSKCATGSGSSAYTAKICIVAPVNDATLSGDSNVTATVTVSGTSPGVQHVAFYLDGAPLLEDFSRPYTFALPGKDWVDGRHTLSAEALLRDQYTTPQASISILLHNGITTVPPAAQGFQPTSGTTPAAGQPFILAAVGDGAGGESGEADLVNQIGSWNPNLLLYLGDVYERGTPAEFYNWYLPNTFYGRFKAITDPTVGNHEYLTPGAKGYFDFWSNIPPYYSFNADGWHFISLNSNTSKVGVDVGSAQYQWLQGDLAADSSKCTVVYFHHPYLSIGKEGSTPALADIWKLLAQYHVTLVLNGHDHEYQRWVPLDANGQPSDTGITEFVAGTGGHSLTSFVTSDNRVAFSMQKQFGALRLQLNPTSADFSYINSSGNTIDSGNVSCKGGG